MAADAEAGHEGRDDQGDRPGADAAREGEDPLPGDLVDERGSPAQEEEGPDGAEPFQANRLTEGDIWAMTLP
jgi:hypothetical protein